MVAQRIVLGITSNSFWFIGVYLIVLGSLMAGMFYDLISKKNRIGSSMLLAILSIVVYFVGGLISGAILGVHFYADDSEKLGLLLSGIPGIVGIICCLITFTVLTKEAKKLAYQNQDVERIKILFSNNYVFGFAQMTMLFGLISTSLASMGLLEVIIRIPDNGKPHLLAVVYFIPFIVLFYLLIKIPKWFEKSVWTYAIQQQLVQDYPARLKRRRDRNR
ncbi:hypothetical protein [Latilactobacillus fuchuensis]|uniref:Uncharacterized protein n=1 Tax=Latilactobacillus fuchuensis TaxID=164393 RepID=A0A2N9DUZ9_9LACO|nr:hypothetical protein [Latilactobacillus fuchuensis]SPC38272.1 membrane hypothetical protein [Latilactobacillus fuchuensis]